MTDVTGLAARLRAFQAALERHQRDVATCRDRLERSLHRLSAVYDGVAAREFAAHWARTARELEDYDDGTRSIAALLATRLSALEEADHVDGR
jgi:uncharacterized protein YukE